MTGPTFEEKRQIFERHFLLGKLSGDEIDTLLHYARVERYSAGSEIFSKGSPGSSMMAVLRGTLKMSSVSSEGKEAIFNLMNPGDCFGEIALLDGGARSTDAVAMTACELLVLHRRDFMPILEKRADICLILLKVLCQRLRQTTEQVEDVLFRHLEVANCKSPAATRRGCQPARSSGLVNRSSYLPARARPLRWWQPRERQQASADLAAGWPDRSQQRFDPDPRHRGD